MITKGTEDYKKAQKLANQIQNYASTSRTNSFFNIAFEGLGRFIENIKDLGIFASQIAETVDKSMDVYGYSVANVSSKQAWILACAAVENNVEF